MNDIYVRLPKKNNTLTIFNKITELIYKNFEKLNILHKKILIKYLYRVVIASYFYFFDDNFIEQLYLNNYQDIFSFLVLLLPYYELNTSKTIQSLDELFLNSGSKSKSLSSSYYIDHLDLNNNSEYLEKYFTTITNYIYDIFKSVHCLLFPNWLNIFPYTIDTYKESFIYKNFVELYKEKKFTLEETIYFDTNTDYIQLNITTDEYFNLGYPILYGTIYNFLYMDIKPIKWMIYDINVENKIIIPNIIYLAEKLKINMISNKPWDEFNSNEKNKISEEWKNFYTSDKTNQISLKSVIQFYLRWEKENENLKALNLSRKCLKLINSYLIDIINTSDEAENDEADEKNVYNINMDIEKCLEKIYPNIKFENIYNYIYQSIQRFKYTWYAYVCMDDNKNILNSKDFFIKYFNNYENNKKDKNIEFYYLTPKNIYNFCKSLIHNNTKDGKYIPMSLTPKWNNVDVKQKDNFIDKLNDINVDWFNISKNIARTYKLNNRNEIARIMKIFIDLLSQTNFFVDVIFHTLVYNGIFTYFKYNPILTDNTIIPDKNKNYIKWKTYILDKVNINPYSKSYHPFSNTMLETKIYENNNTIENIKKSLWYTNFGANWIAQIQLYYHYDNNRLLYITGATGAGKSTLAPFLLVYAVKILNFNNNAKVVCTQPRTQPVKSNSERIAESIGYLITIKKDNSLDNKNELYKKTNISEGIPQNINYIQYKHKNGALIDDLYHPYLRLYTDGSLYNIIKQCYLFKKTIGSYTNSEPQFLETNIFDIILVDEAHEHNTNMDLILTLSKFAVYINNQTTLGIISATMDDDEIIYRKYYEPIDDNWKAPFNLFTIFKNVDGDRNYIDRRIHLSIPFGGMNFEVKEYPNDKIMYPKDVETFTDLKKINIRVIEVLKYILSTTQNGDILIFQPGETDIKRLLIEINKETPFNVIAIPFYSKLDNEILENIVKKIDKNEVRKKIRYPKNKYDITEINDVPKEELLPEGTYKRFIILATNIAEASITIDTFEYVIDIGNQKINIFDYNTNQSKLEIIPIAVPNQKQRKGRVGRVKPGQVYYTYDRTKLSEKVIYKLNIENINSNILDLVSSSNTKLIDSKTDPYKLENIIYENLPDFLKKQYVYIDGDNKYIGFSKIKKRDASKINYPYSDGKYDYDTLKDEDGIFYLIHPNEDYFERNQKTLEILNKKINYFNKVEKIFEFGKLNGLTGDNYLLTPYGKLINSISDFMNFFEDSIDFTKIILDLYSFDLYSNFEILKNIIIFIVFKSTQFNFKKLPTYWNGKSDYLTIFSHIDSSYFTMFELNLVFNKLKSDLSNYDEVIKNTVVLKLSEKNFYSISDTFYKNNYREIEKAIIVFYQIKLKLDIMVLNDKKILKKEFENIFNAILEQKQQKNKISDEYLFIINEILLEYLDNKEFIEKNNIIQLCDQLKKIPETNISKKLSEQIINKIDKLLSSISLFQNEFLIKIKLSDNKKYSSEILSEFNNLNEYDKLCFVIIKNFIQNILVKIPFTEYYVNYYSKDINYVYIIELYLNKYLKTNVPPDIRNFFIFAVNMSDYNELNSIIVINENVILLLDKYFIKSKGIKNVILDKQKAKDFYQHNYDNLLKKIDKITEFITNT
jgi:hypothetical protein